MQLRELTKLELRALTRDDWPAVREIYEQGIATRNATFETEAPDWDAWDHTHLEGHRLVALQAELVRESPMQSIDDSVGGTSAVPPIPLLAGVTPSRRQIGTVVGWAALSPVSDRCVYEGVAENSVYVARGYHSRGIGRALLERLIADAEQTGIWTIQTSVFPENFASIALHLRCGFRVVGIRERIARLDGVWRDTVFLERRSKEVV